MDYYSRHDRCGTCLRLITKDPDTWMRVSLPQTLWWVALLQIFVWQLHSHDSRKKSPRLLNESIITTDALMSLITTDICMTDAFPWLETRVCLITTVWLLQTQTLEGESHYLRHVDDSELHYYSLWYDSCISVTQDTCMRLITTDPDTKLRVSLLQTREWASHYQRHFHELYSII